MISLTFTHMTGWHQPYVIHSGFPLDVWPDLPTGQVSSAPFVRRQRKRTKGNRRRRRKSIRWMRREKKKMKNLEEKMGKN